MKSKLNHRKGLDMALAHSGLNVTQMCNKLGISRVTWGNYRNGHTSISINRAFNISKIAGVDICQLLEWMDHLKKEDNQNEPERPNT